MIKPVKGPFRPLLLLGLVIVHGGALYGAREIWRTGAPLAVWLGALAWYCMRSLGVTMGYHRFWTHGSYRCGPVTQWILAVWGAMAFEGSILNWRHNHRQHHAFTDKVGDPHSPRMGFWWAHVTWLLWETVVPAGFNPGDDDNNWVVKWQHRLSWPFAIGLGFLLPLWLWGWPGLWLCGFIAVTLHWHATWLVNSACHRWGTRPLTLDGGGVATADDSRNNIAVALVTMGEGWHGNHHVKQNSAHLGRVWWHWDPGFWCIKLLERIGLASGVKTFPAHTQVVKPQ